MRRTQTFRRFAAALLLAAGAAAPSWADQANAEASLDAAAAEQRMAELAGRYTGDSSAEATSEPVAAPTEAAAPTTTETDIEQTPLGASAGRALGDGGGLEKPAGGWVLSTFAALGVVIGLILVARWAYAKMGGQVVARSSPAVQVLSRTTVAPKNHVLLLRVGQRVLVVGDSGEGLRTLANLDDPEEVASVLQSVTSQQEASVSKSFNQLVSRFNGDYEGKAQLAEEGGDDGEVHTDRTLDALSGLKARLRSLAGGEGAA